MPSNIQTLPLALNYWRGNQFVPAPVEWAPTPPPAYQSLLETPSVTGQQSPAQQALGISDGGFQGGQPRSEPGQGLNAQSPNFGSFLGSALTTPVGAFGSFAGQSIANALGGNPGRAINDLNIVDTVRSMGEAAGLDFGRDYSGYADFSGGDPEAGRGVSGDYGGYADYSGGDPEAYAKGGTVKHLMGPNPPGPDDGMAYLAKGEHVITAKQAKKFRGLLDAINEEKPKKKLRGLLG